MTSGPAAALVSGGSRTAGLPVWPRKALCTFTDSRSRVSSVSNIKRAAVARRQRRCRKLGRRTKYPSAARSFTSVRTDGGGDRKQPSERVVEERFPPQ